MAPIGPPQGESMKAERREPSGEKCGKHRHVQCGSTRMLAHLG